MAPCQSRDASRRSEGIPESTHPLAEKNFDSGLKDEDRDPEHPDQPRTAVRQDGSLGDTSPRDETKARETGGQGKEGHGAPVHRGRLRGDTRG